jgi:glycosyltransferase involved in cell wall biosynthesis
LKILRVVSDLYPSVVGGIGLHAHEMSRDQTKLGHNVTVYTASKDPGLDFTSLYNYNVYRFKPTIKLFGNSIVPLMLFDLLSSMNNYDVIHAHSHLCFSTNLCSVLKKTSSSPLVITTHGGLNSQTAPAWFQNIYNATGAKLTFGAADKIICYTDTERREMIDFGIELNKLEVIHNGIDTDLFVPAEYSSFDKKCLLWIGRYVPGKGVEYLIEAFSILRSIHPDATLIMVGRGPQKQDIIKKIHNLKLQNNIVLKDFVPNSEIVHLYHNSSVLVLPSLGEGVPRVILEAMSCGIPVVCTKLPQIADIVDGCGYTVPLRDPQAMAEKLEEVLSNPSLAQKFGKLGRRKVVSNYSWKDTVQKTVQLYEELI